MIRSVLVVIVAVFTWFIVATIGNWILRAALPGYSEVEVPMTFTLTMMICRLILGLVSSLGAGFVCAAIARKRVAAKVAAAVPRVDKFAWSEQASGGTYVKAQAKRRQRLSTD